MDERKILVVDDEIHMLKLMKSLIAESTLFQATTTNNSLEVPEILAREHFSVVVTDLRMPGLDGLDVLRWIRDNNRTEEVIIMTAFGSSATATEAFNLGAYDYMSKPFRREEMVFSLTGAVRMRDMVKESARIRSIFDTVPAAAAEEAFREEYFLRASAQSGWDAEALAGETGVDLEEAKRWLERFR